MERISNTERRRMKKETILESARIVFCRKGFISVTMKDIIEESKISRGGIYLYFDSVEEIYIAVATQRTNRKFDNIRMLIKENILFYKLLEFYFAEQKNRLLHMENSMLRSMYEYFFTHQSHNDHQFQQSQLKKIKETIYEILMLGVHQKMIRDINIAELAEHFMFEIEGLSVLALLGGLTEDCVDRQFSIMKSMLPKLNVLNV